MVTSPVTDPMPPRAPMGGPTPPYGGRYQGKPPDRALDPKHRGGANASADSTADLTDAGDDITPEALLKLVREADQISREYNTRHLNRQLARSYRAWRNEHQEGSKYLGPGFKGRSRLFVPKTKAAVRKNVAAAAAALFSTEDVANISAVSEDDPVQLATADVKKELMNYRLGRGSSPGSIPWFIIATGGMEDAQITGVTISKQYWDYESIITGATETVARDVHHEDTGEYLYSDEIKRPSRKIVRDRPMIELIPFENISLDPAAPWYDPVQMGAWFFARYPVYVGEAKAMLRSAEKAGIDQGWVKDVDNIDWSQGRIEDERSATRRVREGGVDRYEPRRPGDWDLVWIVERCIRVQGRDLHFWTVGDNTMLSRVRDMEDVYPAFGGERPYKMGVSAVDTHRIVPMSPVESWQPLQMELNDTVNLRQDSLKRSIAPLAKVLRGKKVDLVSVQRRGQPETVLQLDSMDDVEFEATPPPPGVAYTETSSISAVFDELAGVMSTSSVMNSRQLNETVGGMEIMNGAANAVGELDLRVWVETWVDPVLRQVSKLIDYYESDENALAIAGAKAKVWQRYNISPTLDDLVKNETLLRVNVGLGSSDPMQRLAKMKEAMTMLAPLLPMMLQQGIMPNMESLIEEIFGHAGFKDGMRFFEFGQPIPNQQAQPTRGDQQFEAELEQQIEAQKSAAKTQQVAIAGASRIQSERERNQAMVQIANIKARQGISQGLLGAHSDRVGQREQLAHQASEARMSRLHDILTGAQDAQQQQAQQAAQAGGGGDNNGPAPAAPQPQAQPPQPQPQPPQVPQGNDLASSVILSRLEDLSRMVGAQNQVLSGLARNEAVKGQAPSEVMRDPSGNVIAIKKGGKIMSVRRDERNRIVGTEPLTFPAQQ